MVNQSEGIRTHEAGLVVKGDLVLLVIGAHVGVGVRVVGAPHQRAVQDVGIVLSWH